MSDKSAANQAQMPLAYYIELAREKYYNTIDLLSKIPPARGEEKRREQVWDL